MARVTSTTTFHFNNHDAGVVERREATVMSTNCPSKRGKTEGAAAWKADTRDKRVSGRQVALSRNDRASEFPEPE